MTAAGAVVRAMPILTPASMRGVDAGADAVAEDGAELEAAGVDGFALDHGDVVAAVVAVVFGAGAGAEGDVGADDRVADVALAGDVGVVVNDRVFHLGAVADVAVRADAGGAADVGVGADLAVGADEHGALDDGAGQDSRAVAEAHDAGDGGQRADLAEQRGFVHQREHLLVHAQQVPRVDDRESSRRR